MTNILFNSLYQDPEYTNLKNIIFLFDSVIIPNESMFFLFDKNAANPDARYITLIPNHAFDDIEFLKSEGAVKTPSLFQSSALELPTLTQAVNQGASQVGTIATSEEAVAELFTAFDLDYNNHIHRENINNIASALAGYSVGHAITHSTFSFCENHFIYMLGRYGLSHLYGAIEQESYLSSENLEAIRTDYVISRLSQIYLPKYKFRTFQDALEAKHQLAIPIDDFRVVVNEIANFEMVKPWEPDFSVRMDKLIHKRIRPRIDALHQAAKISIPKITKQSLTLAGSICVESFLAPTLGNLLVAGAGGSLLQSLISERRRAGEVKDKNGLGLFLHIS